MNAVDADFALIGVGGNNKYGHPNEQVLERFKRKGIEIYRTDELGEIIIKSNGKSCIKITTLVNNKNEGL